MPVQQLLQTAQRRHMGCFLFPLRVLLRKQFEKILPHGFLDEQRLRVLRENAHRAVELHHAPIGLQQARQQLQRRRFSRPVSAQKRQKFALFDGQRQSLDHVRRVLFILEPKRVG